MPIVVVFRLKAEVPPPYAAELTHISGVDVVRAITPVSAYDEFTPERGLLRALSLRARAHQPASAPGGVPMPAVDLLQEWQRAEAACTSAYQAMYAKVRNGVFVDADEMAHLAQLS